MKILVCGVYLALFVAVGSAAGPFDGTWTAHVVRPAPAGNQDLVISLSANEGGRVTGSLAIQGGQTSPIEWGFIKGDLIAFKVKMPFGDPVQQQPFVYMGRLDGGQIAFGRRPEDLTLGRLVEFTAMPKK